jgi:hypothetical protein
LAHLLDFMDLEWQPWCDFIGNSERAKLVLSQSREVTAKKITNWLDKQVAPALSVMQDLQPGFTPKLLARGRMRKRDRYSALLINNDSTGWKGVRVEHE